MSLRFFKKIQGESGETACWQSRRIPAAASLLSVAEATRQNQKKYKLYDNIQPVF
jgi:hypothetical protein